MISVARTSCAPAGHGFSVVRPPDQTAKNAQGGPELTTIEPIRRSRLYQGIVEQIETLLEKGELKPGQQLPAERALADQFQVSRASVREALRTLELLGIVETRAGGGTFVKQVAPDDLARPLQSLIARGHTLSDVIEFRGVVEPAIAALAATRITPDQLKELHELLI